MATKDAIFEVEEILGKRVRHGTKEYLIRWKGFSVDEDSWEPESNLIGCQKLVKDFLKKNRTPSPARKPHRRSKSTSAGTPQTPGGFTRLRTRRSEAREMQNDAEFKVLHLKKSPEVTSGFHKVEKKEVKEEKPFEKSLEKEPRYWTVILSWLLAVALFLSILMYLLPVVN